MHVFVHHLWWFYKETDGCINDYAMEGSEKLNDTIKRHYTRNTNKKDAFKTVIQTIEKQGRCETGRLKRPLSGIVDHNKTKYTKT